MIKTNLSAVKLFDKKEIVDKYTNRLNEIKNSLINKTCKGSEFTGWLDWPSFTFLDKDVPIMESKYNEWATKGIDTVVVIGIGGSYIGVKGAIEMCSQKFGRKDFDIIFASGIHTAYNASLLKSLESKNWAIVVISKSGTTFETSINFRLFREKLLQCFGLIEHASRIVAITDEYKGILKELSDKNNYTTLTIPTDIGGRYSTLTSVGLFPMLLSGLNIEAALLGWKDAINEFKKQPASQSEAMIYAASRCELLNKGAKFEVFNTYENNIRFIAEHYKQIFAESEGKKRDCLIPTIANHSEDLHSIGQLYQQGPKNFFETNLIYKSVKGYVGIPVSSFNNDDNLDDLVGNNLFQLNYLIKKAVVKAHSDIASLTIEIDKCDEYCMGRLFAFFAISAATSAMLLEVNAFDQPGVEAYKSELRRFIHEKK